jgi:hypothetical protein
MAMKARKLQIHIDRLIVHGCAEPDVVLLSATVQRELAQLFAAGEMPSWLSRNSAVHGLGTTSVSTPAEVDTESLGADVARAVHARLMGGATP